MTVDQRRQGLRSSGARALYQSLEKTVSSLFNLYPPRPQIARHFRLLQDACQSHPCPGHQTGFKPRLIVLSKPPLARVLVRVVYTRYSEVQPTGR